MLHKGKTLQSFPLNFPMFNIIIFVGGGAEIVWLSDKLGKEKG